MLRFFHKIIDVLDECGIEYMLSGSLAMSIYVLPRSTRDFDFVTHLLKQDIARFAAHFSEGYYCDTEAIADAVRRKSIFNIIDHDSGYKADFVILKETPFRQMEFGRKKVVDFLERTISVVTAEDLFLSKLLWVQDYQSAMQMDDLSLLLDAEKMDWSYVRNWINTLSLKTFDLCIP